MDENQRLTTDTWKTESITEFTRQEKSHRND